MKYLLARLKQWTMRLDGIDDPQGLYLSSLEQRIQALENAQQQLRHAPPVEKPQP